MSKKTKSLKTKEGSFVVKGERIVSAAEAAAKQFTALNPNPNKLNTPEN